MRLIDLRIGTRLGGGFAIILISASATMAVGVWRLSDVATKTRVMMEAPLSKERLAEEYYAAVEVGVQRTMTIVRSNEPALQSQFSADAKASTARNSELLKQIDALPSNEDDKALRAAVDRSRAKFLAVRDAVMKAKRDGNAADADRLFQDEFQPICAAFLKDMRAYLDFQRSSIDATAVNIQSDTRMGRIGLTLSMAFSVLFGVFFAWMLTRSITQPVSVATGLARQVAEGDLSGTVDVEGKDEISQLMQALVSMRAHLNRMVSGVRASTDSITTASTEIATGNQDLSARTEQTASNLQQVASSIEQLTGTVKQSADAASQANQLAGNASEMAERGGSVVARVVATMDDISHASKKIVDIISVIDGIAFQTNILALNAAVEAARAGEQGLGFAVVASEVRVLAQRSAGAAKEIKGLIGASVEKVESGTHLVSEAGRTMTDIVASVERVSAIIGEITAATSEQSQGIGEVNTSIAMLDQMTQQNAALVEQSAAASESLKEQARSLGNVVGVFRLQG